MMNWCQTGSMKRPRSNPPRRRTTLTLPADVLMQAQRMARAKRVNLGTVISEALSDGLRMRAAAERSNELLSAYKTAFSAFSDEEKIILDGLLLDPATGRS
jgi:hypothetical protein